MTKSEKKDFVAFWYEFEELLEYARSIVAEQENGKGVIYPSTWIMIVAYAMHLHEQRKSNAKKTKKETKK